MIEGLKLNIPQRLALLRTILILSLMVMAVSGISLWTEVRDFPLVPVSDVFIFPAFVHWILFFLLLFFWIGALVSKFPKLFLLCSLLLSILMVCIDLNRLQPWFYLYSAMLLVLLFYNGRVDNPNTYTSFFVVLQFVLVSVYFFSGLSMINPDFVEGSYKQILHPLKSILSERQFNLVLMSGNVVPYLFIISALLLTTESLRFLSIALLTIIHLILIVLLFPYFNGKSYSLWISNLSMICILFLLFSGKIKQKYFSPLALLQKPAFYPVLFVFLVLPFLNRSGLWPDYLSCNFKSGNNLTVKIYISESAYTTLPFNIKKFCRRENFNYVIEYNKWCENECHAECFPHRKVFNRLNDYVLKTTGISRDEINTVVLPRTRMLY